MELEKRDFNGRLADVYDSEVESEAELVFVPGPFNPEIWKHQVRFFSKDFRTVTYRVQGSYESEKKMLETVIDEMGLENAVIVSFGPGNALAQLMEDRDEVIATVLTGVKKGFSIPERMYNFVGRAAVAKPKLASKIFFGPKADYRVVKEFIDDLELRDYEQFTDYTEGFGLREPLKDAMIVQPGSDRFSDPEFVDRIRAEADVSVIENAGTFPFYEKPEEYNKALHDFLKKVEEFARSRQLRKTREKNRTLEEYEESSLDRFTEEKVVRTK